MNKKTESRERLATNPLSLACPFCRARPDQPCQLFRDEVELIHVERIQWAAALDDAGRTRPSNG